MATTTIITTTGSLANPFTSEFDTLAEGLLHEFHVPGLSIAIVHNEETFTKGYGFARLATKSTSALPFTPDTLSLTASTTKAFTATALAQIVHNQKDLHDVKPAIDTSGPTKRPTMTWQTLVSSLLPGDFVLPTRELTEGVTVEDILSHRSGLPTCDTASVGWAGGEKMDTPASVTRNLRNFPLPKNSTLATFRTHYNYCNSLYSAAQHLLETLTGQPMHTVLRERIYDVLGMHRSYYGIQDLEASGKDVAADRAMGYRWIPRENGEGEFVELPWRGTPEQGGAGDVISCVSDYALWMRALISQDPRILSEEGWNEIVRPRCITPYSYPKREQKFYAVETYALGWHIEWYRGQRIVTHDGGDPGIGTKVHILPDQRFGVAIFANTSETSNTIAKIIAMHLTDNLLDIPIIHRVDFRASAREAAVKERKEQARDNFTDRADELFPQPTGDSTSHANVDLGIPLTSCEGHYRDSGYGVIEVQVKNLGEIRRQRGQPPSRLGGTEAEDDLQEVLFVAMHDRTYPWELVLLHHNATFFVVEGWDTLAHEALSWFRANVRIDVRGEVVAIGIQLALYDDVDDYIWFDKVQEQA